MFPRKTIPSLLPIVIFAIVFTSQSIEVSAQQSKKNRVVLSRKDASNIFLKLRRSVRTKKVTSAGIPMLTAVPNGDMPKLPPSKPGGPESTAELGAKMWFAVEGPSGDTVVDPTKRRWKPSEKFLIMVEPAVAMTFSITQHGANGGTTLVYPVEGHPETFAPIGPGKPTMIPVPFQLDADFNPEDLVFSFARTDSDALPPAFENDSSSNDSSSNNSSASNDTSGEGGLMMGRQKKRILRYSKTAHRGGGGLAMLKAIVPPAQPETPCDESLEHTKDPSRRPNEDGAFMIIGGGTDASVRLIIKKPK